MQRHAGRMREIIGGAEGKDAKGTLCGQTSAVSRSENFIDCPITAARDNAIDLAAAGLGYGFGRQTLRIPWFPSNPHLDNVSLLPQSVNGRSYPCVAGRLAVQNYANSRHVFLPYAGFEGSSPMRLVSHSGSTPKLSFTRTVSPSVSMSAAVALPRLIRNYSASPRPPHRRRAVAPSGRFDDLSCFLI